MFQDFPKNASLAGPVLQPGMTMKFICQTLGEWTKLMAGDPVLLCANPQFPPCSTV